VTDELVAEVLTRASQPPGYPVGEQLAFEQAGELAHIPVAELRQIQQQVDHRGRGLSIRLPSPPGVRWVRSGVALPKPRFILGRFVKTVTDLDLILGADPRNLGSAGIFEPVMPARPGQPEGVTDEEWDRVWQRLIARFEYRLREYHELVPELAHSQDTRMDATGAIYLRGDDGRWRPVCTDYDLYAVHRPDGSLEADRSIYEADIDYFLGPPGSRFTAGAGAQVQIRHPGHEWAKASLIDEHREGGVPVLLLMPGQLPKLIWGLDPDRDEIPSVSPK
jgi:hypothetical protein